MPSMGRSAGVPRPQCGPGGGAKTSGAAAEPLRRQSVAEITMKDLLEAGVHFGHQTRRWNPQMKKFIFMERNGIYIIDLQKTLKCIQDARNAIQKVVRAGGHVLFVATKKQAKPIVVEESQRCAMLHFTVRWLVGLIT